MEEDILNFAPGAARRQVLKPPVLTLARSSYENAPTVGAFFILRDRERGMIIGRTVSAVD